MLSKAIKKPKKSELEISIEGTKKPYSPMEIELEMASMKKPKAEMEYESEMEEPKKEKYSPELSKVKTTPYESGIKKSPEAGMELELMLKGAKKDKNNAMTKDLGNFEVPKDEKGMFKESGESRANYLRKLKLMKK